MPSRITEVKFYISAPVSCLHLNWQMQSEGTSDFRAPCARHCGNVLQNDFKQTLNSNNDFQMLCQKNWQSKSFVQQFLYWTRYQLFCCSRDNSLKWHKHHMLYLDQVSLVLVQMKLVLPGNVIVYKNGLWLREKALESFWLLFFL